MTGNTDNKPFFPDYSTELPNTDTKDFNQGTTSTETTGDISKQPEDTSKLYKIMNIYSWIMCPLLLPFYAMLLVFSLSILTYTPIRTKISFILIVGVVNTIIPMLFVFLLKAMRIIHDMNLNTRRERTAPYIVVGICLVFTGFFLGAKHSPIWVETFFIGGAIASLINLIINIHWKISAHATAAAGVTAMLIRMAHVGMPQHDITTWIIVIVLLSGLLGSARIYMGRNTLMQVLAGYFIGFCSVYFLSIFTQL